MPTKYFTFLQLQVAGFQTYHFHIHDVFYIHIDTYYYFTIDFNCIFLHQIYIYIRMIYTFLMFSIHLFLQICRLKQMFLFNLEKFTKYWASAFKVVSSNLCLGRKPRIQIFFLIVHRWARINFINNEFFFHASICS